VAFGSGTATTLAAFSLATPGGRVVCATDCYYGTAKQLRDIVSRWNVRVEFVDTTQIEAVEEALAPGASLLWIETPSNPLLKVSDIGTLVELAHAKGALVGCDNDREPGAAATARAGADLAAHSSTKHSAVTATC
jgi:cystathionine gamma-synthase